MVREAVQRKQKRDLQPVLIEETYPATSRHGETIYRGRYTRRRGGSVTIFEGTGADKKRGRAADGSASGDSVSQVTGQERAQPGQRHCGNCGKTGHNARTCQKDAEEDSASNTSASYAGSAEGSK
ncbi:hypothetical protein EJ07DRAFT_185103 [Lizonia empirigonia]|nr:hypothetical protein EJ07DRAFT_185103 [Lizonia empirigonia]